jgi:peptidoglycan/xylan/chitin deacetylase (PgdA/CDA1 family)
MAPPSPPPFGFGRLMAALLLACLAVVAWRGDVLASMNGSKEAATGPAAKAAVALAPRRRDLRGDMAAVQRYVRLGHPLYCGGGRGSFVALTFDDGPGPYTAKTLDILKKAGARATFFLVGRNLETYPGLAEREAPANAVGDHTWNHAYLTELSTAEQEEEIDRTRQAVAEATSGEVVLFRPPGGFHDGDVDQLIAAYGLLEVMWSTDSRDSAGATTREVFRNAVEGLKPGAIILLHENRGTTLQMLPRLLAEIARRGLKTVTVPELLRLDPPSADQMRQNAAIRNCAA